MQTRPPRFFPVVMGCLALGLAGASLAFACAPPGWGGAGYGINHDEPAASSKVAPVEAAPAPSTAPSPSVSPAAPVASAAPQATSEPIANRAPQRNAGRAPATAPGTRSRPEARQSPSLAPNAGAVATAPSVTATTGSPAVAGSSKAQARPDSRPATSGADKRYFGGVSERAATADLQSAFGAGGRPSLPAGTAVSDTGSAGTGLVVGLGLLGLGVLGLTGLLVATARRRRALASAQSPSDEPRS